MARWFKDALGAACNKGPSTPSSEANDEPSGNAFSCKSVYARNANTSFTPLPVFSVSSTYLSNSSANTAALP